MTTTDQTEPAIARPHDCPTWCIYPGECAGDHAGEARGTVVTGGLPPRIDDLDAPSYNTVLVGAQHPVADDLAPGVALFGSVRGYEWQVDMTVREARALLDGLQKAIESAEAA